MVVVESGEHDFEEQYIALFARAERVATRIVGSRAQAEEIAAETMVRALGSWRRVRTYSVPWVTRVATNMAIDVVRRRSSADRSEVGTVDDRAEASADRMLVLTALKTLPDRQRRALVLHHLVGLDIVETAQVLGVTPGTVKTHLERATHAMRSQLAPKVGTTVAEVGDAAR